MERASSLKSSIDRFVAWARCNRHHGFLGKFALAFLFMFCTTRCAVVPNVNNSIYNLPRFFVVLVVKMVICG